MTTVMQARVAIRMVGCPLLHRRIPIVETRLFGHIVCIEKNKLRT